MEIGLNHFLIVAAVLFVVGLFGIFVNRKSIINILLSIEILLLAININLAAFSAFMKDIVGQVFIIFILTAAAAEAGVGLAILAVYHKSCGNIDVEQVNLMKE